MDRPQPTLEERKEGERRFARTLLFAVLLILSHILKLEPSEIDAGGIKVALGNAEMIRGAIGLIYIYYLWTGLLFSWTRGENFIHEIGSQRLFRRWLRNEKRPYKKFYSEPGASFAARLRRRRYRLERRSPREAKSWVRRRAVVYNIASAAYVAAGAAVLGTAASLLIGDVPKFFSYAWAAMDR